MIELSNVADYVPAATKELLHPGVKVAALIPSGMIQLGSLVARALDLRLDGREFDSRPPRLVLEWLTVF